MIVVNGWVNCDGSAVSRTVVYNTLFAKMVLTWGVGTEPLLLIT